MKKVLGILLIAALTGCSSGDVVKDDVKEGNKIVVAHRGASGYLPEHSMAAKSMAYAMNVDYIEQDVVMTKDNELVVLHDHYLDRVTNVADVYPDRKRDDGRYYAIDFTLEEIKGLRMTEGFNLKDGKTVAGFPKRFPIWKSDFRVHTLAEEIELIQGLNESTGNDIGIYPEVKAPWFHRNEGKDISVEVLKVLKQYGYTEKEDLVYFQCFDPNELERVKNELLPEYGMDIKIVQLIAETSWNETMVYDGGEAVPYNYDWMFEEGAMERVAEYADGIGPWKPMVVSNKSTQGNIIVTDMVKDAHEMQMEVHPYTFRLDDGRVPEYATDFEDMLDIFYNKAGVDGVFTDYPDRAVKFLENK